MIAPRSLQQQIDSVARVQQTAQGESVVEFRPFYSLRHGENPERTEHYWVATRNDAVAQQSPGYELELSMVDVNFDPVTPKTDVLSLELTGGVGSQSAAKGA